MLNDRIVRQKIKKALFIVSIVLSSILAALLLYGVVFVMPKNIANAVKLGQYYEFDSDHLPSGNHAVVKHGGVGVTDEVSLEEDKPDASVAVAKNNKPKIAILLTNLGLNKISTELALSLPKEIALGFLPYTTTLKPLMQKAHELEHEIYIYLPFETKRYPMESPGHMPILLSLGNEENTARLSSLLKPFEGYKGVYGSYKEIFTADTSKLASVIDELRKRNLKLFVGRVNSDPILEGENGMSVVSANIVLDTEPNVASIKNNLDKLIELAQSNKYAVAYAQGYPVTIYTLKAWLPTLEEKGIELVSVSYMMEEANNNVKTP